MNWSEQAWQQITPIYASILRMPFITELITGSLDKQKFQFYLQQDSGYLEHFSRALAIISARAAHIGDSLLFLRFAENAILVENSLHESYFADSGVVANGPLAPVCHHYVHFLKSTAALEPVEVGMSAVLPCFWLYKAVGDHILQQLPVINNPYQRWINTYGGAEFSQAVEQAIASCDRVANHTTTPIRQAMTDAFITASHLEYNFWDAAYRLQGWQGHPND